MAHITSCGKRYLLLISLFVSVIVIAVPFLTRHKVERSAETPQQVVALLIESMRHGRKNRIATLTTPVGWRALQFSPQKMGGSALYQDTKARHPFLKPHQTWTIWKLWASRLEISDFDFESGCDGGIAAVPPESDIIFFLDDTPRWLEAKGSDVCVSG